MAAFVEAATAAGLREFTIDTLIAALANEGIIALTRTTRDGRDVPNRKRIRRAVEGYVMRYTGTGPERQARREAILHRIRVALLGERTLTGHNILGPEISRRRDALRPAGVRPSRIPSEADTMTDERAELTDGELEEWWNAADGRVNGEAAGIDELVRLRAALDEIASGPPEGRAGDRGGEDGAAGLSGPTAIPAGARAGPRRRRGGAYPESEFARWWRQQSKTPRVN